MAGRAGGTQAEESKEGKGGAWGGVKLAGRTEGTQAGELEAGESVPGPASLSVFSVCAGRLPVPSRRKQTCWQAGTCRVQRMQQASVPRHGLPAVLAGIPGRQDNQEIALAASPCCWLRPPAVAAFLGDGHPHGGQAQRPCQQQWSPHSSIGHTGVHKQRREAEIKAGYELKMIHLAPPACAPTLAACASCF